MAPEAAPARRFRPEPAEVTIRTNRKPKEGNNLTSSPCAAISDGKASKTQGRPQASEEESAKARRGFVPEPFEYTRKSSRDRQRRKTEDEGDFRTDVPEATVRRNRNTDETRDKHNTSVLHNATGKSRRRFAPQLVETLKRTRRAGDNGPAILPADKTEAVPLPKLMINKHLLSPTAPEPPVNTPIGGHDTVGELVEARRLGKSIPSRSASRNSCRSHSFRVPDLEPIESSQSEGSSPPSLSTSPTLSHKSYFHQHATRIKASADEKYSGYLLQVAAKAAEKQLRDQAMAAFPNNDYHEHVDHYIDDGASDTLEYDARRNGSRSSFSQVNWDLREMKQFQQRTSKQKVKSRERKASNDDTAKVKAVELGATPGAKHAVLVSPKSLRGKAADQSEKGVRPPMLGSDIEFPRCPSPDSCRFDVTQSYETIKRSICPLTEQIRTICTNKDGLWCAKHEEPKDDKSCENSIPASPVKPPTDIKLNAGLPTLCTPPDSAGLWGGFCVAKTPKRAPSGLMTPRIGISTPIATPCPSPHRELLGADSSTDQPTDYFSGVFSGISEKLEAEIVLEREFNDAFVTQVYNYLSLGYPSIARDFDAELSKISRIDVSELRQDDHLAEGKGYIRLGEDCLMEDREKGICEESCARWRALKVYVREWARQEKGMGEQEKGRAMGGFGVGARRGSWAN